MREAEESFATRHAKLLRALDRFEEALALDPAVGEPAADGAIQRFEFSFETFWRVLRAALEREGIAVGSPRASFRAAYANGWLDQEQLWLDMLDTRNLTSHTYDADLAATVLPRLPAFAAAMRQVALSLPGKLTR